MNKKKKPLLDALNGKEVTTPPIWLMRQAGRYLPEYKQTRAEAGDFLSLCYNPKLAEEVTLQPIRRYGFDAAILFADILLIPDALDRNVRFKTGEGPLMDPLEPETKISYEVDAFQKHLSPIYETLDRLKGSLPDDVTLIGFAGAPWTVATYIIAGKGTPNQEPARRWIYAHPQALTRLIDTLVETTILYLREQIKAGAEVIKLFDSWAGSVPAFAFDALCLEPVKCIAQALKAEFPDVPVIVLAKGAGTQLLKYRDCPDIDCVALDPDVDMAWANREIRPHKPIQGNLDPLVLEIGGDLLEKSVHHCLKAVDHAKTNYIFNLGHGIRQHTPPAHVETLMKLIRG